MDVLLETYSKRNPIVVLHNVYMDQNWWCMATRNVTNITWRKLRPYRVFDLNANETFTRNWDLNEILTVTRCDILTSFWGPFQHLRPFSFNIWDLIGYLRSFAAFDTLFIQHLRPYSLFEAHFGIWDPFHSTFETLLVILRPFSAFDTLLADSAAHRRVIKNMIMIYGGLGPPCAFS